MDEAGPVVREDERAAHMAAVQARMRMHEEEAQERLQARAELLGTAQPLVNRRRLLDRALKAKTSTQRIFWLRREADLLVDASRAVSACARGCSHCCNIGVLVSRTEAVEIGKAIGQRPAAVAEGHTIRGEDLAGDAAVGVKEAAVDRHMGTPCVFLDEGKCSIYRHRPLACRHLVNLDDDDLLCRLVPGESISVPYLDARQQQMVYVIAMGANAPLADIRDWFPKPALG